MLEKFDRQVHICDMGKMPKSAEGVVKIATSKCGERWSLFCSNGSWGFEESIPKIKFCPYCGIKLEKPQKE